MATLTGAGHTGRLGAFAECSSKIGLHDNRSGRRRPETLAHGAAAWRTQRALADQPLLHRHPRWRVWPGSVGRCHFDADRRLDLCRPRSRADLARPTVAPGDYFDGGAILSKGGHLGYGLAPIVEIVGEAMPGPVAKGEINWMLLAVHCHCDRAPEAMRAAAEEVLSEIRACPSAPGFDRVEAPGERERDHRHHGRSGRFAHPCTDLGTNKGACLIRQTAALRLLPRVPRRHCSGRSRLGPGSKNRARSKTGRRCASVAATGRRW